MRIGFHAEHGHVDYAGHMQDGRLCCTWCDNEPTHRAMWPNHEHGDLVCTTHAERLAGYGAHVTPRAPRRPRLRPDELSDMGRNMSHANHSDIRELIDHLDSELAENLEAGVDFEAWSDGDQLRTFAYAQLHAQHNLMHIAGLEKAHLQIPRIMLRIAARLDLADEQEELHVHGGKWLTVTEAAGKVGKSAQTIRSWCRSGAVRARKRGRDWLVDPTSIGATE